MPLSPRLFRVALVHLALMTSSAAAASRTCAAGDDACFAAAAAASYDFAPPPIIIGCWQLLERKQSMKSAIRTLSAYARAGFTHYDTADIYGPSERILGEFRAQYKNDAGAADASKLVFFTKFVTQDSSLREARRINAKSRAALKADRVRLVQLHWWQFNDDDDDAAGSGSRSLVPEYVRAAQNLAKLQKEGHVQTIGVTNFDVPHLEKILAAGVRVRSNQVQFSLLDRRAENGMLAFGQEHGIKMLCYGAVAGGWLSAKFKGISEDRAAEMAGTASLRMYHRSLERWIGRDWSLFQALLGVLEEIGAAHGGRSIAQVAARWVLERLEATSGGSLIIGVRDEAHLDETAALLPDAAGTGTEAAFKLTPDDMSAIAKILARGNAPRGGIYGLERGR